MNYARLQELKRKVSAKTATKAEENELMELLHQNGSITRKQLEDYKKGENADRIMKAGLVIAGILLLGYLINKNNTY